MNTLFSVVPGAVRDTFLPPRVLDLARELGTYQWYDPTSSFPEAEVLVTCWGSPRPDEEMLARLPKLKLLTHLGGTVVPVVSEALWDRGIRVISGNDYYAESVAEGTVAYMLSSLRDIPYYSRRLQEEHTWKTEADFSRGLLGKTVGLVSYGAIARHLVRLLQPFRVRLLVYDIVPVPEEDKKRYGIEQVSLETLFSTGEIVSVHTPLNAHTHGLIGKELFDRLPDGALFVNTSRGAVLDQRALEEALSEKRFRAVLDVYDPEPPTEDCPLYKLENVLMMPHMGGPTVDLRAEIAASLLKESAAFLEGKPLLHEIPREKAAGMSEH